MALGFPGVLPSGHEENVDPGPANRDRLLLDAADRDDGAVELDLARRGDLLAAVDVLRRAPP